MPVTTNIWVYAATHIDSIVHTLTGGTLTTMEVTAICSVLSAVFLLALYHSDADNAWGDPPDLQ